MIRGTSGDSLGVIVVVNQFVVCWRRGDVVAGGLTGKGSGGFALLSNAFPILLFLSLLFD